VAIDNTISEFWAYFHRACAETAINELPVKNLTPPFAPATSMSYKTRCISTTEWRLLDIFDVFVLLRRITLWPLTFDLLTLRVCHVQCFSCLTHIPIFIILWLSVTELRVLNIWSHFRYLKQSLRMRRVTWPLTGGKNSPQGSLYLSIPLLKQFSVAKKHKSSQNRSSKWRFFGNLRVKILNIVIGTPKKHFLTRNDVTWRILRKCPSRGVGCSLIEEPQKTNKKLVTPKAR